MWVCCLRQYSTLWYMLFKPYTYGHVTSSSVQYSTVQYSTVQYSTVQYSTLPVLLNLNLAYLFIAVYVATLSVPHST